ncbi:MAG: NUDIX hydrolase [Capsulimonadaceae bacterium]
MADYNKIGLFTLREGRVLLCRKHSLQSKLILPGGCLEAGETALECLQREIREELGDVTLGGVEYIGAYEDRAASDDPSSVKTVRIELYRGDLTGEPAPCREIAELVWVDVDRWADPESGLSQILISKIFPDLAARGFLGV